MKRYIFILAALLASAAGSMAQNIEGVAVDSLSMSRDGKLLTVQMDLLLDRLAVDGNSAVLITPRIVGDSDSLDLHSVGIYGRRRYFYYLRNGEEMISGKGEESFRATDRPGRLRYEAIVPYEKWMNGSQLVLHRYTYGCCDEVTGRQDDILVQRFRAGLDPYIPALAYIKPEASAEKIRELSGKAFIDFPVNMTTIYPEYRNNPRELEKIRATIDSVRNDSDITIRSLSIKGFASPESPYSNNKRLAKGRTEALKGYISQLYRFEDGFISTSYEPEDWEGLKAFVKASAIEHRDEILGIIDEQLEPDAKEWKIKSKYPEEYRFLLDHCYPALRHSDYRIEYVIRSFSDPEEIRHLAATQPQKLSLNEFYLAAQGLDSGSTEFNEIFETAVRMYPDDKAANLNAANTAMARGDLGAAGRYLDKAGDSPQAMYARGVFALLSGDGTLAEKLFIEAREAGVAEAAVTLEQIDEWKETE